MKKSLSKRVRKVEQHPIEKPHIKFNTSHTLRENSINHSKKYSINTEKDKSVPAESPEREGGDNRFNTELVNSQTFHDNRMAEE